MGKFFKSVWKWINVAKSTVGTILFLIIMIWVISLFFTETKPKVPDNAALVIAPQGFIVERKTNKDFWQIMLERDQDRIPETLLRDIASAIKTAKTDERISALVINMDYLFGAGLSQLHYISSLIEDFKKSGKPVLAYGLYYANGHYLVASHADEIYMHPLGSMILTGYGSYVPYFKSAIDKIKAEVNVFRSGVYKSFGEPYMRDDMSDEAKEANMVLLTTLWDQFLTEVSTQRGIEADVIQTGFNTIANDLRNVGGDIAQLALDKGLVDGLMTDNEWTTYMTSLVGPSRNGGTYNNIYMEDYVLANADGLLPSQNQVAIIVAKGEITFGEQRDGNAGSATIIQQLQQARFDDNVKAVVFRIDSPGGSMLASELIREEVELLKQSGKPVVVSMGAVAASGGYWISAPADEIWAQPSTITGSIGVIGIVPTFEGSLDELGIHIDGVGTTPLAGEFNLGRSLSPLAKDLIQQSVDNSYAQFINMVAEYRSLPVEDVDAIGQGRVWSGQAAYDFGLVDALGTLDNAIESAAARADMVDYDVRYIEQEPDFYQQLAESFRAKSGFDLDATAYRPGNLERFVTELTRTLEALFTMNDPNGVYALCELCEVR